MSIYPNWLMSTGDGTGPGITVYVDGLDFTLQDDNLACDIESSDLCVTIENNDLSMEII
jgi:hypothetical protein